MEYEIDNSRNITNGCVRSHWHRVNMMSSLNRPYFCRNLDVSAKDFELWLNGELDFDMEELEYIDMILSTADDRIAEILWDLRE